MEFNWEDRVDGQDYVLAEDINTLARAISALNNEIPTKTSDLSNDSNFVEDSNYVHTDNNYTDLQRIADETIASNSYITFLTFTWINGMPITESSIRLLGGGSQKSISVGDLMCVLGDVGSVFIRVVNIYPDSPVEYSSYTEFRESIVANKIVRLGLYDVELIADNVDVSQIDKYVNTIVYLTKNAVNYPTKEEVPTKTSDLLNDSNFVQDANYVHTDNNFTDVHKSSINASYNYAQTAINIAQGANQAKSFNNYGEMIDFLNLNPNWGQIDNVTVEYQVGQNIMIGTVNVPDLWIASGEGGGYAKYDYTTDEVFINDLNTALANGTFLRVGWITLGILETQKVDLTGYPTKGEMNTAIAGGDPKYELIQTITVADDGVTEFIFDKDINGNSFKLDAISVHIDCQDIQAKPPGTDNTYWVVGANGKTSSNYAIMYKKPDGTGQYYACTSERLKSNLWWGTSFTNFINSLNGTYAYSPLESGNRLATVNYIESLKLKLPAANINTKVTICGRRVKTNEDMG